MHTIEPWIGTAAVAAATLLYEQLDQINQEALESGNSINAYATTWCDKVATIVAASIEAAYEDRAAAKAGE